MHLLKRYTVLLCLCSLLVVFMIFMNALVQVTWISDEEFILLDEVAFASSSVIFLVEIS
jgi:hypothetical protein